MKYKLTLALVAALTSTAFAAFQAPLPEFKNEKQLAEWRAQKASEATSQGYASEETAFYTGKPYLASSGGYAFKYRSYNPEVARWTSEDPSGFPDGANGYNYIRNHATSSLDLLGLVEVSFTGSIIVPVELDRFLEGSAQGKFKYTLDKNNIHFAGAGEGSYTSPLTGDWISYTFSNGDSAALALGSIRQTDQGVEQGIDNFQGMKRDWITITAYFNLNTTTKLPDGASYGGTAELILENYTARGGWYE